MCKTISDTLAVVLLRTIDLTPLRACELSFPTFLISPVHIFKFYLPMFSHYIPILPLSYQQASDSNTFTQLPFDRWSLRWNREAACCDVRDWSIATDLKDMSQEVDVNWY